MKSTLKNDKTSEDQNGSVDSVDYQGIQIPRIDEDSMKINNSEFTPLSNPQKPHSQSSYRPDIDGLRTIAITIVIIFHAFPEFMPGGYVGVDVFFVISGYLISGIIIKQAKQNKFSYLDFYSRRIKRIYPALLVVLIFVLYWANHIYEKRQLILTAKTMAASTIFGANIQILTYTKGYFDPDVKQNPLLHLWSLGVEEQFYIVWPCFITILFSRAKISITLLLSVFTLSSFIFGTVLVYYNVKFAFYFPVCRFWQMSIGGLIVHLGLKIENKMIRNLMSIGGTILILAIVWIIDQKSLFPGWWALVPTLSSACILQAGPDAFINKFVLSSRLFVFIGKISYPLYLWHWPLLVLSAYMYPKGSESIFANTYFVLFLCLVFSAATYYFVENKIRFRKQKIVVLILLGMMAIMGLTCVYIINKPEEAIQLEIPELQINDSDSELIKYLKQYQKALIPGPDDFYIKNGKKLPNSSKNRNRQSTNVQKLKASRKFMDWDEAIPRKYLEKKVDENSKFFEEKRPNLTVFQVANQGKDNQVFIVGDSHAKFLVWRFQYLHYQAISTEKLQDFPTVLAVIKENAPYVHQNQEWINFAQSLVKKHLPKRVLFAHRWFGYWQNCWECPGGVNKFSEAHFEQIKSHSEEYANLMKQLVEMGIEVHVVTVHIDDWNLHPNNLYDANGVIEKNIAPIKLSEFRETHKRLIGLFEQTLQKVGVKLVHLSDNHCWEDTCYKLTPSGHTFFIDDNHYGKVYSRYWASSVDFLVDF